MMKPTKRDKTVILVLASALTLSACAGFPTEPSQMALPGKGKSYEVFKADNRVCRQDASMPNGMPDPAAQARKLSQRDYDRIYTQCMYGKGHRVALEPPEPSYGYAPTNYPAVPGSYMSAYPPAQIYPDEAPVEWIEQ